LEGHGDYYTISIDEVVYPPSRDGGFGHGS
jgi:hypothetical protein